LLVCRLQVESLGAVIFPETSTTGNAQIVLHSPVATADAEVYSIKLRLGADAVPVAGNWLLCVYSLDAGRRYMTLQAKRAVWGVNLNAADVVQHLTVEPPLPVAAGEYIGLTHAGGLALAYSNTPPPTATPAMTGENAGFRFLFALCSSCWLFCWTCHRF